MSLNLGDQSSLQFIILILEFTSGILVYVITLGSGDAIGIISLLRYSTCKQRSQESKHLLSYHIMVCDNSFTIFCSRIKLLGKSSKNCFEIQGLSVNSQVLSIVLSVICRSRCSTRMSLEDFQFNIQV